MSKLVYLVVVPLFQLVTTPWRRIGEWRYSFTHSLSRH